MDRSTNVWWVWHDFPLIDWWNDHFAYRKQESHAKASHPKELWDCCPLTSCSWSQSRRLLWIPGSSWLELTWALKLSVSFRYLAVECSAWISGQQRHWVNSGDFEWGLAGCTCLHSVTRIDECWTCWIQLNMAKAVEMNCTFYKHACNATLDSGKSGSLSAVQPRLNGPVRLTLLSQCYNNELRRTMKDS